MLKMVLAYALLHQGAMHQLNRSTQCVVWLVSHMSLLLLLLLLPTPLLLQVQHT